MPAINTERGAMNFLDILLNEHLPKDILEKMQKGRSERDQELFTRALKMIQVLSQNVSELFITKTFKSLKLDPEEKARFMIKFLALFSITELSLYTTKFKVKDNEELNKKEVFKNVVNHFKHEFESYYENGLKEIDFKKLENA